MFSDWLAQELKNRNWSQPTFAKASGISRPLVTQVLGGKVSASCEFCLKTAAAFDIPAANVLAIAGFIPSPLEEAPGPLTVELMRVTESLPPEQRAELLRYAKFLQNSLS